MKKCTKCEIEKPLTEYYKSNIQKNGLYPSCKTCVRQQKREYHALNKEKISQRKAEYYAQNKEKIDQRRAEYYALNKEKISQRKAEYYAQNREKIIQQKAEYYVQNKEKINQRKSEHYAQKAAEQPACIYQIKNVINNKVYIGQTTVGQERWKNHLNDLRGNRHGNPTLQQDFNEYGEEVFKWSIIKELPKDKEMLMLEEAKEIQRILDHGEQLYNKQIPKERE